jgi:hypothetical protein
VAEVVAGGGSGRHRLPRVGGGQVRARGVAGGRLPADVVPTIGARRARRARSHRTFAVAGLPVRRAPQDGGAAGAAPQSMEPVDSRATPSSAVVLESAPPLVGHLSPRHLWTHVPDRSGCGDARVPQTPSPRGRPGAWRRRRRR